MMTRIAVLFISVLVVAVISSALVAASELAVWPPRDPGEAIAHVPMTTAWASGLRDIRNFDALQKLAGSGGQIISLENGGEAPHAVYNWTGAGGMGQMRAFLYRSGDFGVVVIPADGTGEIRANNFDAFVCAGCSPPVNACGRRPSWVSHAFHWNEYDCGCTVTGPQTIRAGAC